MLVKRLKYRAWCNRESRFQGIQWKDLKGRGEVGGGVGDKRAQHGAKAEQDRCLHGPFILEGEQVH